MRPKPCAEIKLVKSGFVVERWDEIVGLLAIAFEGSALSGEFQAGRPAQHTWEEIHKPGGGQLSHVVAFGKDERILGAIFCLETERPAHRTTCDVGWFLTDAALRASDRARIGNAMVTRVHDELRGAGYEAVVTEMGTEEGAVFLARGHGYVPASTVDRQNRWIKPLRTVAESDVSSNSEKRLWADPRGDGQLARYVTADIAKDEVVIDLKPVLQIARRPSVDTLQLSEGFHYRSSVGMVCMNHSCDPNGYIRFDDLTYCALRDVSAGEELTFNYCTTEYELAQPFQCACGSPNCYGLVRGARFLDSGQLDRIYPLLSIYLRNHEGLLCQ
jgi:hypothetical protein